MKRLMVLVFVFTCFFIHIDLHAMEPIQVTASIMPQKYFVEKIAGRHVRVEVMCPPGAFPGMYEPRPAQMVSLSRSKVFFAVGVPYEKLWLGRFEKINPNLYICHTDRGIEKRIMKTSLGSRKVRGPVARDPHCWLSPPLVMIQARNILDALVRVDPGNKKAYYHGYRCFIDELVRLDLEVKDIFSDRGDRHMFMVFHPSWGYFADAYGLEQVPIEIEGKEPRAADLGRLIDYAKEHRVKEIFVQPQQSKVVASGIAEAIGARLVDLDPLSPDWERNIVYAAKKIRAALR